MAETNKPTRSTLGTTTAKSIDPNIQIYLDAKAASSNMRSNWDVLTDFSSEALSGIEGARETKRLNEEARIKELESYENEFSSNVNTITESAGGLGEEYFGLATGEASLFAAVKSPKSVAFPRTCTVTYSITFDKPCPPQAKPLTLFPKPATP